MCFINRLNVHENLFDCETRWIISMYLLYPLYAGFYVISRPITEEE